LQSTAPSRATPLLSFDVFDTLVTRRVAAPADVFLLVGQELVDRGLWKSSPALFATSRAAAEVRARTHAPGRECTHLEIWRELQWALDWDADAACQARELELGIERRLVVALPGCRDELRMLRQQGTAVRFVSDTYLSADTLSSLLSSCGFQVDPIEVFCSSDHRCSKRTGALFERAMKGLRVPPAGVVHHGNDEIVDIGGARLAGIDAQLRPQGNLTEHEKALSLQADRSDLLGSALAAASRLARLEVATRRAVDPRLLEISTAVVGPVLAGYVFWVLRDAAKRGLKRLYFVARDGQVLKGIADPLATLVPRAPETRYLYGSRLAWVVPSIADPKACLEWVLEQSDTLGPAHALARIGVPDREAATLVSGAGVSPGPNRDAGTRDMTVGVLIGNASVTRAIREALARKRESTIRYLRQEGVSDLVGEVGFVDIGWRGSLYRALGTLLGSECPSRAYQFGLRDTPGKDPLPNLSAYFFDLINKNGYCDLGLRAALLVESFCAGSEGVTSGYEEENGRWRPVLASEIDRAAVEWGVEVVHEATAEFARQVACSGLVSADSDFRPLTAGILERFWDRPGADDAAVWGRFPMADGPAGLVFRRFAEPYSPGALLEAAKRGEPAAPHPCAWIAGSRMITPSWLRTTLDRVITCRATAVALRDRITTRSSR
jgi:FMN phosphatase YigB (HAD superfamily)